MSDYSKLLSPLTVNGMHLKNRVAMMPMGSNMAAPDGGITEEHILYYEQRAKGGTGLIIVENACVDYPLGMNGPTQLRIDHDCFVPGLSKLADRVHKYGACVALQINHAGAGAMPSRIGGQCVSSSDVPSKPGGPIPRPLTEDELTQIAKRYAQAAERARVAGFDAVEIHCGHVYLLNQFLSPVYNRRTDRYGGSAENRARFPRMVLQQIRQSVGPGYPIILRISADDLHEKGNTQADVLQLMEYLDAYADMYNVSVCVGESVYQMVSGMSYQDGWRAHLSEGIRDKFGKPAITQGNIGSPAVAERILDEEQADVIGMGRALIADPQWVNKVQSGRESEIRPCIYCNVGCTNSRNITMHPIRCTVNPDIIHGEAYKKRHVSQPVNVVVLGGGSAGMEAACTAAEVGCTVSLLEAGSHLGGMLRRLEGMPAKRRMGAYAAWLERRLAALPNAHVFLNKPYSLEEIRALKPQVVVNATGAMPVVPGRIPGLRALTDREGSNVYSIVGLAENVERLQRCTGKRVVVIGGGAVGMDAMEFFAQQNNQVTIVEMMDRVGRDLDFSGRDYMAALMKKHDVSVMTNTKLLEARQDAFVVERDNAVTSLAFDVGVVCMGLGSTAEHVPALEEFCRENRLVFLNIGNSKLPRQIINGSSEARDILLALDDAGYLP